MATADALAVGCASSSNLPLFCRQRCGVWRIALLGCSGCWLSTRWQEKREILHLYFYEKWTSSTMSYRVPAPVLCKRQNPRTSTGQKCCMTQVSPSYLCASHRTRASILRTPPKPFADHHPITDKTMSHELNK